MKIDAYLDRIGYGGPLTPGFTCKVSCSLATPDGRSTLTGRRLITTRGQARTEHQVTSIDEYRTLLKTQFGIDLGSQLETLWHNTAR